MRSVSLYIILMLGFLTSSCYKPYFAEMESEKKILIVEGMITSEPIPYGITLKYALPFNTEGSYVEADSATVYVKDENGIDHYFSRTAKGYYRSDPREFRGAPGGAYTLFIEMPDGNVYKSGTQKMCSQYYPDSVYAVLDYKETLSQYHQMIRTLKGANILADVRSRVDTIPHFRFKSVLVKQYFYSMQIPPPAINPPLYLFYCWESDNSSSGVNLTNKDYALNSNSVKRHSLRFVNDEISFMAFIYGLGQRLPDMSYIGSKSNSRDLYPIRGRILYIDQYTLNNEAFAYYKSMDEQLLSQGKLFDPVAAQLKSNMKCITDSTKQVAGFFEASAVSHTACRISVIARETYQVKKIPYVLPPLMPNGCIVNKVPDFWDK
jgi:hypothetical protein